MPDVTFRARIRDEGAPAAAFALDTTTLAGIEAPRDGLAVVTGPSGSGRTVAVHSLVEAIADQAAEDGVVLEPILISPMSSQLADLPLWEAVADNAEARERIIEQTILGLGGEPEQQGMSVPPIGIGLDVDPAVPPVPEPEPTPFPQPGRKGLVVIEDIGAFDGTGNERRLAVLLKTLRRQDILTIVEGENATLTSVWELAAPLRGARWALALQPDGNDAPSIFTVSFAHAKRSDFKPGSGWLVRGGAVTGLQVALPSAVSK